MRHLLPTSAMSPPRAAPIPSDRELLIQRMLGTVRPVHPVVQERSSISDIEILLQSASSRIGGRGECGTAGVSSGADSSVFFVWRVEPCDFVLSCSGRVISFLASWMAGGSDGR